MISRAVLLSVIFLIAFSLGCEARPLVLDLKNSDQAKHSELKPYMISLRKRIEETWLHCFKQPGKVELVFKVDSNGALQNLSVLQSNKNSAINSSALRAVRESFPFAQPPKTREGFLLIHAAFKCNKDEASKSLAFSLRHNMAHAKPGLRLESGQSNSSSESNPSLADQGAGGNAPDSFELVPQSGASLLPRSKSNNGTNYNSAANLMPWVAPSAPARQIEQTVPELVEFTAQEKPVNRAKTVKPIEPSVRSQSKVIPPLASDTITVSNAGIYDSPVEAQAGIESISKQPETAPEQPSELSPYEVTDITAPYQRYEDQREGPIVESYVAPSAESSDSSELSDTGLNRQSREPEKEEREVNSSKHSGSPFLWFVLICFVCFMFVFAKRKGTTEGVTSLAKVNTNNSYPKKQSSQFDSFGRVLPLPSRQESSSIVLNDLDTFSIHVSESERSSISSNQIQSVDYYFSEVDLTPIAKKRSEGDSSQRSESPRLDTKETISSRREFSDTDLEKSASTSRSDSFVPSTEESIDEIEQTNREVELMAMNVVAQYERSKGRTVKDVSMLNVGYDIESSGTYGVRAIEVKGRSGKGRIVLTKNEWNTAASLQATYFLYVVENLATEVATLKIIQNPYSRMKPDRIRYQYSLAKSIYESTSERFDVDSFFNTGRSL